MCFYAASIVLCKIMNLYLAIVDAQAGLNLTWLKFNIDEAHTTDAPKNDC